MNLIMCPVSCGELLDKISILKLKLDNIADPDKRGNVKVELEALEKKAKAYSSHEGYEKYVSKLKTVNSIIWTLIDKQNFLTKNGDFGGEFTTTARGIFEYNNRRYAIKKEINEKFDSAIKEEKSF